MENEIDALKAERLYNCGECAYCSEKESQLKSHMAEDHTHQCPECDNNFVGKKKLETSMQNTWKKPYFRTIWTIYQRLVWKGQMHQNIWQCFEGRLRPAATAS